MRFFQLFFWLLVVLVTMPSMTYAMGDGSFMTQTLIGKPAPDFTLDTLSAKQVNMTSYRSGKKAIIFFWATWCPHCRVQLKELNARRAIS